MLAERSCRGWRSRRGAAGADGQVDAAAGAQAVLQHPLGRTAAARQVGHSRPERAALVPRVRDVALGRRCGAARELQRRYGPVRFVVGHTMTSGFRVMGRFSSRVFLIDTGMLSSYYQGGRASALEIERGIYAVVTDDGRQVLFDPMTGTTRTR